MARNIQVSVFDGCRSHKRAVKLIVRSIISNFNWSFLSKEGNLRIFQRINQYLIKRHFRGILQTYTTICFLTDGVICINGYLRNQVLLINVT